jgi:AraC-like DNA-binding protein
MWQRSGVDDVDVVRAWRAPEHDRVLWLHGVTTRYRVDPAGELVVGVCLGRGYHLRRGRARTIVRPGQLVVLDPSATHGGSPADRGPWEGRLLVIEAPDPGAGAADECEAVRTLDFPEPQVGDRRLGARFLALHRLMDRPASTLERQSALASFLQDLAARSPAAGAARRRMARDDAALRRACEHLRADPARNVSLDELAAVAGTSRYRLVRLFTAAFGLPPHAFQVAQRVALARRLIERGMALADVAGTAGFVDQSHLHRHFRRRLGMTPRGYAVAVGRTDIVAAAPPASAPSAG